MNLYNSFLVFLKEHLSVNSKGFQINTEQLISFKYKDLIFLFRYNIEDDNFFQISLPRVYDATPDSIKIINDLNRKIKVAKGIVIPKDDNEPDPIWIVSDQFAYTEDGLNYLFFRTINVLFLYYTDFKNIISGTYGRQ